MDLTTNYGLRKPAGSDYYNIADFNHNADAVDTALHAHATNLTNPHGVTAAQVGAMPGVEAEKYIGRIHETPNLIADPLVISQAAGAAADANRTFRFSYGTGTERRTNYPTELQTGTIMGIREVQWSMANQVVVKLTEWYPILGRTWYNRWTGTAWTDWVSHS